MKKLAIQKSPAMLGVEGRGKHPMRVDRLHKNKL